ncbi:MAG: DEAD/DEAH box helicase, partial [Armatimonadetes bacterium]|nr:DEAD/DEAH box helicase [Armatimonadota bacterium]
MLDPVGAFDAVRDNFILYVKTAFGTRFESIEAEREALLKTPGVLCQDLWIELLPQYLSSGKTVDGLTSDDLPKMSDEQRALFRSLVSRGLCRSNRDGEKLVLHEHQREMLQAALQGTNCVITAGTGSGKTESFLLPLFAQIAKELVGWEGSGEAPEHLNDWWKDKDWQKACRDGKKSYRVGQRTHEKRRPAMRAMILYPMNALVEDQMTRLRRALDSDTVRECLRERPSMSLIYFGRYNSDTPIPGHEETTDGEPDWDRLEQLAQRICSLENNADAARKYALDPDNLDPDKYDATAFFPRL